MTEFEGTRPLPVNMEQEHADYFKRSSLVLVKQVGIIKIKRAFIFWNGIVFKKRKVVEESLASPQFIRKYSPGFLISCILKSMLKGNLRRLKNRSYLVIYDEWGSNYFHWLTDTLTRLYLAKHLIEECTLVLPESFCLSYHHYVLKKFGVTNIQWTNSKMVFFAKEVFLPLHTAPASNYNSELLRNAVSFLLKDHCSTLSRGEKIYISREKAATRKILNEEDVVNLLKSQRFTILFAEEFSFEQQVSIFSQAKILISTHGAGLTNLMFMPVGSCVLEFRNGKNTCDENNCYFNLASVFGHHYFYQACEPDSELREQEANIYVSPDKLKENLELMGKK